MGSRPKTSRAMYIVGQPKSSSNVLRDHPPIGVINVIGLIGVIGRIGVIGAIGLMGVIGCIGGMTEDTLLLRHAIGRPLRS
jgi:hypothetical protein